MPKVCITKIMSKSLILAQQGQAPSEVYHLMHGERSIHHIPIVDGRKLVGVVSSTDFLKAMFASVPIVANLILLDKQFPKIKDMMSSDITTIKDTDTIHEAAEKLMNGSFHSLPVVDKDSNAVGIVTSTDLIKYLCEHTR